MDEEMLQGPLSWLDLIQRRDDTYYITVDYD